MRQALNLIIAVLTCLSVCGCGQEAQERPAPDIQLLASDVHLEIADHRITLPWVALEDYAYAPQSFSLDRGSDRERREARAEGFQKATKDAANPAQVDSIKVVVRTYGWNDADMRQRAMCPLLTKEWSRSVCDNPWAAIQQALPGDRFTLVDLATLEPTGPTANCTEASAPHASSIEVGAEASLLCDFDIYSSSETHFYTAVIQISDNLGAVWAVWESQDSGETATEQAIREGKAIQALVRYGLGETESFFELHREVCQLRRPNSSDGPGPARNECE